MYVTLGFPREVFRVKGAVAFPDGEDQVQQFPHAVTDGDVAACASGLQAAIESTDGGIVTDGGPSRVPEIVAYQIVAFARHAHRPRRQRVAVLVDAGAIFLGKDAEV